MNTDRPLHLTLCNSVKTYKVAHISETWAEVLIRLTAAPEITETKESPNIKWPLFVPFKMLTVDDGARIRETDYGVGYSRCAANVEYADLICLDIDNDPTRGQPTFSIDDAKVAFDGLAYVLYTSFNHQNRRKDGVDKFRVVLPLAAPATYVELAERRPALKEMFPFIDPASLSISQPFYVPIAHPDRLSLHQALDGKGEWFNLLDLEPAKPKEPSPSTPQYLQTGKTHSDLPDIRTRDGITRRGDILWNHLQEGYEHKMSCYRIGSADKNPGCFIYRKNAGLMYWDPAIGKMKFIKVMKLTKVRGSNEDPNEPDANSSLKLVLKPSVPGTLAKPREVTKPDADASAVRRKKRSILEFAENPPNFIRLNLRYLPKDLHLEIPEKGITVIRSPKGSGKTKMLEKLTAEASENRDSVMLLGHRVYLLKNLASRTNLDYYRDLDDGATTSAMALCLNSLTRLDTKRDEPYHTIIIDESEQVLQALTSPTLQRDLSKIFRALIWLLRRAKRIICLDADLSAELTIEIIQEIRGYNPEDEVLGIINDYKIGEGQTTKFYEKKMHMLSDALDAIDRGEKVFITCNSRKFATVVDAIAKALGKNSLLVTAETNQAPETQDFIENPTDECRRYDLVVASPTLSTGVSIDGNHFTKVYGFFGLRPGTYQDVDQAVSRVRHCSDVSVWVQGNTNEPRLPDEQAIYDKALEIERGSHKSYDDEEYLATQGELLWARIYARITTMVLHWSVKKDKQFADLRKELGFAIDLIPVDKELDELGAIQFNRFKGIEIDRAKAVFDAPDIDPEEEQMLERKRQRTHEEYLSLEKCRLYRHLRKSWSVETVRAAQKQELLQSLSRIRTLHTDTDENRKHHDQEDRGRNKDTFTVNRHRSKQAELIKYICESAGIDREQLFKEVNAKNEFEIEKKTVLEVAKAFEARKKDFNYYFDRRIRQPTEEKTLKKVWNAILGDSLSLYLVGKKRGPKAKREVRYFLDTSRKALVHSAREMNKGLEEYLSDLTKKAKARPVNIKRSFNEK